MPFYAHAVIEAGDKKYQRGDAVPEDVEGFKELLDGGSVRKEQYDAEKEPKLTPEEVEIDGVVYRKSSDGAESTDERS